MHCNPPESAIGPLIRGVIAEQVLGLKLSGNLAEDRFQLLKLVWQEGRAPGLVGQSGHAFLSLHTDLIEADRRPARIDGIEEAVRPLQLPERIAEFIMITVIV